jgi:hypothetical protein
MNLRNQEQNAEVWMCPQYFMCWELNSQIHMLMVGEGGTWEVIES